MDLRPNVEIKKRNQRVFVRGIDKGMFFFYIVRTSERCQSGRLGRSRNPESVTGPRVRIPLSPEKIWSPLWAPYFFIRDTPNPRRGFDKRLRNEVKRSRLRFWPKARTRRAAMERSDNAVSSLSRRKEKEPLVGSIFFHKGYSEPSKRVRQTSAKRSEAQTSEILAEGQNP